MSPKKSTAKSTGGSTGKGFKPGPDARRGKGPPKGSPKAGRPRHDYIDWCKRVISDKKTEAAVRKILRTPDHPQFGTLYGKIGERAHGRAGGTDIQIPIRPEQLSDEQLQRIAQGEDPLLVLATTRGSESPKPSTTPPATPSAPSPAPARPAIPAAGSTEAWPPPPPPDAPA